jgi:hypothetical protein
MAKVSAAGVSGKGAMVKANGKVLREAACRYDRAAVSDFICKELEKGRTLQDICRSRKDLPDSSSFVQWAMEDTPPGLARRYAQAREFGYRLMADEIIELTNQTHEWITIHKQDSEGNYLFENGEPLLDKILMPLNSDVIAHRRLQIDTRKWILSKVLPKIYGDKVVQEHVGANGGPITIAAVNVKNLNDVELEQMEQLMLKASNP